MFGGHDPKDSPFYPKRKQGLGPSEIQGDVLPWDVRPWA